MWEVWEDDEFIFGYIEFGILMVYSSEDVTYMVQKGRREVCIRDTYLLLISVQMVNKVI